MMNFEMIIKRTDRITATTTGSENRKVPYFKRFKDRNEKRIWKTNSHIETNHFLEVSSYTNRISPNNWQTSPWPPSAFLE
jgi:hypothetical protein